MVSKSEEARIIVSRPPPERMRRLKLAMSWLIVALGCLVGFLVCVAIGFAQLSSVNDSPAPHLAWFGVAGMALLGLVLITSALVAVRNRTSAGFILLAAMPVAVSCLAYSASDEGAWLPVLAGGSVPFLLPGLFWVLTERRGWPPLAEPRSHSLRTRVAAVAATCVAILCLDVVLTLILCALGSSLYSPTCGTAPPFRGATSSHHAVFTARVVFAGPSIETRGRSTGFWSSSPDSGVGDWAIGVVEDDFWGIPRWTRLVLLTNHIYWKGETYFVDGRRSGGLLTQFLPIVEGGVGCSRTRPVQRAAVDLRLLRTPPSTGSTRLTGYVVGPETFRPGLVRPQGALPAAGTRIDVMGETWTGYVTTDSAGVYELDGLPPGDYTLQPVIPPTQTVRAFSSDELPARVHLDRGGVVERDFQLFWDGRIEGKVSDMSGAPAHAWVKLLRADGKQLAGSVDGFEMTADDGSYRFRRIPRGRYLVVVNPGGPGDEWPHDIQYYPDAVRKEQARVFELANGERVSGVDFRAPLLPKRDLRVRVTWADGTPVPGASVCVAYDKTDDYEALAGYHCPATADQNGDAAIRTYGNSQVRVFAQRSFFGGDEPRARGTYRSQPVQYAADQTPNVVRLVLDSRPP